MIEIVWLEKFENRFAALLYITNYFTTLLKDLAEQKEKNEINIKGYVTIYSEEKKLDCLIFCETCLDETKLVQYLQEAPGEYKGKYIARIPSEEPEPVNKPPDSESDIKDDNEET